MRVFVFAVVLVGLAGIAPTARADDKSEINALLGKLAAAFRNKDTKAVFALCTSDFTEKHQGMTITAKQSKQQMDQMFAMAKSVKEVGFKSTKVDVKGNSATLWANGKSTFVIVDSQGMFGAKGLTHTMSDVSTSKCDLVKQNGKWRFKVLEILTESSTMDGKPIQMGGPPPPAKK